MTPERCPHCGQSMKRFWHRLTPGMVRALIKAYRHVSNSGDNKFHLYNDLIGQNKLSTVEQMNWTKLRFHALVAKVKEDGVWQRGYWLITKRGADFLKGKASIPNKVQTWDNSVVDHSTELVTLRDVMKSETEWEENFDYDIFAPQQKPLF